MQTRPHPYVAWVQCAELAPGVFQCACTVCNAQMQSGAHAEGADRFARVHAEHQSASATHYGAGDLVAKATSALGIKPCTPCEARRRQLNGLLPALWKR